LRKTVTTATKSFYSKSNGHISDGLNNMFMNMLLLRGLLSTDDKN